MGVRVRVLGPVVIEVDGDLVPVRRPLERGLLARLALARGSEVSDARLSAALWDPADTETDPDADPAARLARLRVVVSRLRRTLGPAADAVVRGAGGYRLVADVADLQVASAAADRLQAARRHDDHPAARVAALEALDAWRGPALSDLRALPVGRGEGERLDEWWLELTVHRLDAEIAGGAGAEVVAALTELTAAHPLHERLRGMLAVALYRSGRQADALAALAALRRDLAEQLGVDPTAAVAELEVRLLRQDPDLHVAPSPGHGTDVSAAARGIVGRRAELAVLAEHVEAARAGRPSVVLVEGGPGLGRTRLLEAAGHLGEQHGMIVCWGRATDAAGVPAFWPWRQVLQGWARRAGSSAAPVLADAAALDRIAPGLTAPDPTAPTDRSIPADPDDRFGLFEHVVAFLGRAASAGPGLVVLLDDLHLADLASLLLLAHLARSDVAAPWTVVASLRPGELGPDRRRARTDLLRAPRTGHVELTGLDDAAVTAHLALVLGREPDPDDAATVARRTGGNPLFVEEIGRMMVAGERGIPSAVREAVGHQIEGIPAACRAVLAAAAVLAGEVEADEVAAAVEGSLDDALDQLDVAAGAGLLQRTERAHRYRFVNDIVRDVVADDVGGAERGRMHLRAAEHLESVGTGTRVHRIAHHRLEALPRGDRERAANATSAAADLALRQFAFEDAVALYEHALDAGSSADLAARAELLLRTARAQHLGHDISGAMRSVEQAAALAEHLGDTALLGRSAMVLTDVGDAAWLATTRRWCRTALAALPGTDAPVRAQLMATLAVASVWDDDGVTVDSDVDGTGRAALEMATRLHDAPATSTALRARQLTLAGPEHTRARLDVGDRMLALVPTTGDPAELWGRLWRFDALVQLGRIHDAENELDLLEPVVARLRQPLPRWHLVRGRAALLAGRGLFAEARDAADEAVLTAARGGHRAAEYPAHVVRLTIAELTGDPVDRTIFEIERAQPPPRILSMMAALCFAAHGELAEAERLWAQLPRPEDTPLRPFMLPLFWAVSGSLAVAVGDHRAAEYVYDRLAPHADLHVTVGAGVGNTGGSVHLPLGTMAAALDRTDVAIDHLRAAVTANTAAGLAPYAAVARRRLAAELRRRGRADDGQEADVVAAEAATIATRLGMTPA